LAAAISSLCRGRVIKIVILLRVCSKQAQALANRAYQEAAQHLPGRIRAIYFTGVMLTWRRARAFTAAEKRAAEPQSQTVS
jgi:hypothetical protein